MKIYVGIHSPTAARKKKIDHIKPFVMKPKWEPLEKVRDTAQNVPGLYMMAFDKPVKYDKGISRVIYIGSSIRLRERLRSHYNCIKSNFIYDVTRGDLDKIFACFFKVDVKSKNEIQTVEQIAFDEFALKFGVQPLGNWNPTTTDLIGEIILGEQPEQAKSFLEHVEDDSGKYALSFDEIAEKYGLEYERDKWSPRIMFHAKEILKRFKKIENEQEIEKFTITSIGNVCCWDKDKMLDLLKIAMDLKEEKNKRLKVTRRFISETSEVPKPHTWGEVALVLGRYSVGTWSPEKKINIEIKHKNGLLGKGILLLESMGIPEFRGYDVANIPQRETPRSDWFDRVYWNIEQAKKDFKERPEKVFRSALAEIESG